MSERASRSLERKQDPEIAGIPASVYKICTIVGSYIIHHATETSGVSRRVSYGS